MGDEHRPNTWGGSGKRSVQAVPRARLSPAPATEPVYQDGPDATDAAKALAAEHQIDLANVTGTGADGRITKDDVAALVTPPSESEQAEADSGEPEQLEVG